MVKAVLAMSESTYWALCYRDAGCLSGVRTYLQGTVLQAFKVVSEPTCQALCYSGESCFSNVGTYLPGTVLQ